LGAERAQEDTSSSTAEALIEAVTEQGSYTSRVRRARGVA
jgi:hypothetical protein